MVQPQFTVRHSARIVFALGWSDFILKYRGSVLGYLWSFAVPLVKFLVIYHIFRPFTSDIAHYPLYLFLGILLWEHFAMATTACMSMLYEKEVIVKKVVFPRILLIFAVGWTHIIVLLTYIAIYCAAAVLLGPGVPYTALFLGVIILQATLLSLGIGMLLASVVLRFRDVQHLWAVILQLLFWLTPIMYAYRADAPLYRDFMQKIGGLDHFSLWTVFDLFIRFQPLSILLHDTRRALLYSDTLGVPSGIHTVGFTVLCALIFAAGLFVFRRRSRYFVEEY